MKLSGSFPGIGFTKSLKWMMNTSFLVRVKEAATDALDEEWEGYVVQISGGNDKGFP